MKMQRAELDFLLEEINKHSSRLNDWERGFMSSIARQYERSREKYISGPQRDKLLKIYEKVTNP